MTDSSLPFRVEEPQPIWPGEPPCGLLDGAEPPTLQAFLPEGSEPTGAVVVCPGGGYAHLADHEAGPVARWLAGLGIAALVLRYRVSPHRHPSPLSDVLRAVRLTRFRAEQWNIDSQRVAVLGFSAGGHLAASAATMFDREVPGVGDAVDSMSARPDAAVLCYPVILDGPWGHGGSCVNLLGEDAEPSLVAEFSRDRLVTARTPPTFLWHTADDSVVDVRNSLAFAAACREHEVPVELHVFPTGVHGIGLAFDHPSAGVWTGLCASWLASQGFVPGA
jgi:acetyl esterase/lipase